MTISGSLLMLILLQAISDSAKEVHARSLVLDTHADTTQPMIYESSPG